MLSQRKFRLLDGSVSRWVLLVLALVITLLALWLTREVVLLTLTAVIFAILLTTPVRFFVRHGVRRPIAILLTVVLIMAVIVLSVALLLPDLFEQFRILVVQTLPRAGEVLQQELRPEVLAQRYPFLQDVIRDVNLTELANQISQQLVSGLATATGQVFPFLGNLVSTMVSILIVIFLSLYFVADPDTYWRGMLKLVPLFYRPRAREILLKLDYILRQFLQAQLVLMLLTGALTALALALLRLPLAGVLGVITGLFSFVPNFGPLIALIPIIAVAIINSPDQLLLVLIIFFGVQTLMGQIIAPLMFGQETQLAPAVVLLSQIISSVFFGFLGLLLSVPLAAILIVLVREIYVRDVLGDHDLRPTREVEAVGSG